MRIFLLLIILVVFNLTSFTQPSWTRVHSDSNLNVWGDSKSRYIDHALLGDSVVLITAYMNTQSCATNKLLAYDTGGSFLWEIKHWDEHMFNQGGFSELVMVKDDYIFTAGMGDIDDVSGFESFAITKMDNTGTVLFQEINRYEDTYLIFIPRNMDISADYEFILSSDYRWPHSKGILVKADNTGKITWNRQYDFQPRDVMFLPSGNVVVLSTDALYLIDQDGEPLDTLRLTSQPAAMHVDDEMIYLLTARDLLQINFELQIQDTLVSTSDFNFGGIRPYGDKIWVMGTNDDKIALISLEGKQEKDTLYFGNYLEPVDFAVTGSKVIFLGTSATEQLAMYGYDLNFPDPDYPWPNLELVDFDISNIEVHYDVMTHHEYGQWSTPTDFDFDAVLTIRNNGPEQIDSLFIYSMRSGGFNCVTQYYFRYFTGLSIPAGGETQILFGRSNEYSPPKVSHELCFEVLAPNGLLELDTENNTLCKTFAILSVEEKTPDEIAVFPNPVKDILHIRSNYHVNSQIELIDLHGRLIKVIDHFSGDDRIDFSGLTPGIYFLRISADGKPMVRKILRKGK